MRSVFIHSNDAGAVIPLVAIMLSAFVFVSAMVVDISSVYTAQGKLQQAVDSALLGAASTHSDNPKVSEEFNRMLRVNFPDGYLGAQLPVVTVVKTGSNSYGVTVNVSIRYPFSSHMGMNNKPLTIVSQVTNGYNADTQMRAELALVVDNTQPMSSNNRLQIFKDATIQLNNMLYGNRASTNDVLFSLVPFSSHITLDASYGSFVTNPPSSSVPIYINAGRSAPYEYTDTPPNGAVSNTLFTRSLFSPSTSVPPIKPGLNSKNAIQSAVNLMNTGNSGGIDTGVEWGWYLLSPAWQGKWSTSYGNGFPSLDIAGLKKIMVLMVSSNNSYMEYGPTTEPKKARLAAYCNKIKEKGYKIFTVMYDDSHTGNITSGENLLRNCATESSYYFQPKNSTEMRAAITSIGTIINSYTIRLSQ